MKVEKFKERLYLKRADETSWVSSHQGAYRHIAILKKVCRLAYKNGHSGKYHFQHFALSRPSERTPCALSRESFEKIRNVEIAPHYKTHILAHDQYIMSFIPIYDKF